MQLEKTVKKYDTYKDSGIEWIGEIPQVWKYAKLAWCSNFVNGYAFNSENMDIDGEVPVVRIGDIQNGKVIYDTCLKVNNNNDLDQYELKKDDIVMAMSGATTGKLAVVDSDDKAYINQRVGIIRSKNNKFIRYCLDNDCFLQYVGLLSAGSAQPNISMGNILDYKIPYISYDEQQQIADYLDKKCGEIDRVIETEKLVIEKLKEYKQLIITEAVTKGLDKSVPLKDSGIEWIGKIPQHWDVLSLARIANIVRGASPRPAGDPMYFCGNFCPWITVAEVTKDNSKYIFETEEYLTELGVQHSKLIDENTFLLSNSGATLGVPKITKIKGCINDGSLAFLDISCNMDYLYYVLKSRTNEFRKQMQGYGQPNLNTTIVKAFKICLPSTNEQIQIAEYLDKKCSEIDKAISDKEQVIEKFTEYKKSLIYECVTGKRKVV